MVQKHAQVITYWILVFFAVSLVVLGYYHFQDKQDFLEVGSRFTGEDAIWLLENSNIVLTPESKIEGQSTPFRDYINGELQK